MRSKVLDETGGVSRRFRVRAWHLESHHARIVVETTVEAAAVAYIETAAFDVGDDELVRIVVRDLDSGHEHCFRVDLATGEAGAC